MPWDSLATLAAALAPFLMGLVWWLAGYRKAKNAANEKALDHAKRANEIDEAVDSLPDADRDRWLYGPKPD